ncbi:MAG TPA: haloacid dehalogenase type II [Burkholderiales bacterium]|nr:haloacid dehalogenase type II [Burkholderiales bacterium]
MNALDRVHTLTFDAFGTILDLGGSHAPRLAAFLEAKGVEMTAATLWGRWRTRQRIEQYQDNQFCAGHYGYLDSSRRALLYTLRALKLPFDAADIERIMQGWQELKPFPDALPGLARLKGRFKLAVLSNGERDYLAYLVKQCMPFDFAAVISVQEVGVFKPNPQVYRYAARVLNAEPHELMMVSAHSFDAVGARTSGYRAAYVNRYDLPYDETPYRADLEARDFLDLATQLGCA